jgi:hypothetical protein
MCDLSRCDDRPREEKLLQPEKMLALSVMGDSIDFARENVLLMRHPVVIPLV